MKKKKDNFLRSLLVLLVLLVAFTFINDVSSWFRISVESEKTSELNLNPDSEKINQYPFYVNHKENYAGKAIFGLGPGGVSYGITWWGRVIDSPIISTNYYAKVTDILGNNLTNNQVVPMGSEISFELKDFEDTDIVWNGTGWLFDTPYGRWVDSHRAPTQKCAQHDYIGDVRLFLNGSPYYNLKQYAPFLVKEPNYSIEHEGTAQLDCTDDGFNCSVVSPGTIDSKIVINETTGKFYYQYTNGGYYYNSCGYTNTPMKIENLSSSNVYEYPGHENYLMLRNGNNSSQFIHQVPQQTINFNFDVVGGSNIEPPVVSGPDEVFVGEQAEYTIVGEHPDDKDIQFGTYYDGVSGGFTSYGTPDPDLTQTVTKEYNSQGIKEFKAITKDIDGSYSLFSNIAQTTVRPLPDVNLSLDKDEIVYGESTTLTWSADYADTCWSDDFETNNNTSGSIEVSPNSSKAYEVTCDSPYDASVEVSEQDTLNIIPAECRNVSVGTNGSIPTDTAGLCDTGVLTDGPNESTGEWEWRCGNTQCSASCPDGQIVDPNNGGQCVDGATNVVVDVTDWEFNPRIVGEADDSCTAAWDTSQFSHPDETICKIVSNTGDEIPVDTLSGEHSSDILPGNSYRMSCRFVYGVTDVSSESEEQSCVLNPDFSEF